MSDDNADKIAKLEAEVAALKAKVDPPKSTFVPESDEEWRDRMRAISERRMDLATPPSVAQYFADGVTAADCADLRQQARRPSGRPGMIPASEQPSAGSAGPANVSATPGWVEPTPLGPQPGINWVDAQLIADEVRQRAELKRKLGEG
jgi:hypothetical protein